MELASILAGEPFSDHPRSVCPVVAGFLRSYNDGVRESDRQDLYRFASEAVGTRGSAKAMAARAELCHDWLIRWRSEIGGRWPYVGRLTAWPLLPARPENPTFGPVAGRVAARLTRRGRPGAHASALALVERMLAISDGDAVTIASPADWLDAKAAAGRDACGAIQSS
jgi:hypothetical protein